MNAVNTAVVFKARLAANAGRNGISRRGSALQEIIERPFVPNIITCHCRDACARNGGHDGSGALSGSGSVSDRPLLSR